MLGMDNGKWLLIHIEFLLGRVKKNALKLDCGMGTYFWEYMKTTELYTLTELYGHMNDTSTKLFLRSSLQTTTLNTKAKLLPNIIIGSDRVTEYKH